MYIPFNSASHKPAAYVEIDKEISSSKNTVPANLARIESLRIDECSVVSGGPQISNHPPN